MSKLTLILTILFSHLTFASLVAEKHSGKIVAGPHGGKILHHKEIKYEFFVQDSRYLQIAMLNEKNEVIDPAIKSVSVICGDRLNPVSLSFSPKGKLLISDKMLPGGSNLPAIITLVDKEGKILRDRIQIDLSSCGGCVYKEYACTCDH